MFRLHNLYNIALLAILMGVVLFLLLADFGHSESLIIDEIVNFGHLPLFGISSLLLLWIFNGRKWPVHEKKYYVITFATASALGIATEFLQTFTPDRDFEILDVINDFSGSFIFLALAYPSSGSAGRIIKTCKATVLAILLFATIPIQRAVLEAWRMHEDFPLIDSFERRGECERWVGNSASTALSSAHATHGSKSLEAHLKPGIYPGIQLERLFRDWRGYDSFSFDVFLEGDTPLKITVRIHDAEHDYTFQDRFNKPFILSPGNNHIAIGLEEVRKAPRTRPMDMGNIIAVTVFSFHLSRLKILYFDNFRLEKIKKPSSRVQRGY